MANIEYYISKLIKKMHFRSIKDSDVHKTAKIHAGCLIVNSSLGKYSSIGYDCTVINTHIGNFCSFGANIKIGGASHPIYWGSTSTIFCEHRDKFDKKLAYHYYNPAKETKIGNDVWIGDSAMIKAGVTVSNGAVIGTGAVVTKDVGPYEIWAGNPAKCIKRRFDADIIRRLEETQWWSLQDEKIKEAAIYINDIEKFLLFLEKEMVK